MKKAVSVLILVLALSALMAPTMGLAESPTKTVTGLLKYPNGIIYDPKSGLEWYVGPDRDINWDEAQSWTSSLKVGGGGWRMPTWSELQNLYRAGLGPRNMDPAFKTTGWWVWSGQRRGSVDAWCFYFQFGCEYWLDRKISGYFRVFAVRSRLK